MRRSSISAAACAIGRGRARAARFRRALGHSVGGDAEGLGRAPDGCGELPRHAGHARHARRQHGDRRMRSADLRRRPLRRSRHRQAATRSRRNARIIHIDGDPAEIGKLRRPEVGIGGDLESRSSTGLTSKPKEVSGWRTRCNAERRAMGGPLRCAGHRRLCARHAEAAFRKRRR